MIMSRRSPTTPVEEKGQPISDRGCRGQGVRTMGEANSADQYRPKSTWRIHFKREEQDHGSEVRALQKL